MSAKVATVLVVDKDDTIRGALADLLKSAGYPVILVEEVDEAMTLIDRAPEPLVLIVGNTDGIDHAGVEHFTAVAADPMTQQAYLYFTVVPERRRLPMLVRKLTEQQDSRLDIPYELAYLLAVIAAAAERTRPESIQLGGSLD